jgi:hypothetical protein
MTKQCPFCSGYLYGGYCSNFPEDCPNDEGRCKLCRAPNDYAELCEECAKDNQPVDLEGTGGWMAQDAKP